MCLEKIDRSVADSARHRVRCVVKAASEFMMPSLSREAERLMQGYYTYIRNPRDFDEHMQIRPVPVHVFHTLVRLAMASAKLTLSPVVCPVPDVTLAIKLVEETLVEMVNLFEETSEMRDL